ncbi:MAG: carbon monoxide dehydrogenase subunit [Geminicoccaceae bacterium]|nr:carbon monoxide dehydrogenase subunit [Geminicoccaceae bacterium]
MPLKTEETFQVHAPADRVWAYLVDPRQVVTCLPGAELTSVQDESTFLGKVKVKVGPVVAAYSGKVVITERDDAAHVVRMVGEGRESAGSGSAKVAITSTVVALPGGGTEVRVTTDLDIVGKIAQFGRGMIESVNKQMFRQFTECVRANLETPPAAVPAPVAASATLSASAVSSTVPPAAPADATFVAPGARQSQHPTIATVRPVRLLPLIGRALWDWLANLLRRLVGRRPNAPR